MPVMLELPAPEPQAEPSRLPFCLRPQAIRIFAAVCKFLLELAIMILYLPPGTPATARNLALAGARGCIYLVISGLGYTLVLTIQSQGDPDQATWITSTVNDALGVPDLSCQPLVRQKRGALDFLFPVEEVTTITPTLPVSILTTTLQPAIRVTKAEPDAASIGFTSPPAQPQDPRRKQETQVVVNPATLAQDFPPTGGTEPPSSTFHPTSSPPVTLDLLEPDHGTSANPIQELFGKIIPATTPGLPSTSTTENPCPVLQEQTVLDLKKELNHVKTQLGGQVELVAQYAAFLTSTQAKQEMIEKDLHTQTQNVHELKAELSHQVDLVAQYDAFLTSTEEKQEVLKENLHQQTQKVQDLEAELANQKNNNKATAGPIDCLEEMVPSATPGTLDVPETPPQADPKAETDTGPSPSSLLSPPLDLITVGAAGLLLAFFALLTGRCCGARKRKAKLLLDQKLTIPGSSLNQPILRRVRSVGKNGKEALVDLTTVDLPIPI